MKVAILGAGAGGAAVAVQLCAAGHAVSWWGRSAKTLEPFLAQGGVAFEGVYGTGLARPELISDDLAGVLSGADVALVCLPTTAHDDMARAIAATGLDVPVVLNPGHTGGALEFAAVFRSLGKAVPPIAEFNTLTHVARIYAPGVVTVTGAARYLRLGALPGGERAAQAAQALFPAAQIMPDVLACDLVNLNMVLHVPGAVLGAAWVEATGGEFTFYVQGMTPGVARLMRALDDERRAVGQAFGHDLPSVTAEMQRVGTVEASADPEDFAAAIASGGANARIRAPNALSHRYYVEDFGHGLQPFVALADISGVAAPLSRSLMAVGQVLIGDALLAKARTAARMGIAGLDREGLLQMVRGQ